MADEQTKVVISLETILRGLDKTLRGLAQVEKQLKAVASIKVGGQTTSQGFDKAAAAATRLQQQQKRLELQAVTLANREERARQTTERLAQSRDNLTKATERAANTERRVVDRSAREVARVQRQTETQARRNERERTRSAKIIADVQSREAKRGADSLIRTLQQQSDAAGQLSRRLSTLGNSLRSIGQGAAQIGLTLSATVTAPLVALAVATTRAAVTLDSLTRGLAAITGSSQQAATQLVRLEKIAKLPGIGFEEAIQGSIRLQAVGFSAAEAEASLIQFANAIALTGGGRDELARVTIQLGQLAAKGKVLSQDLRPIIEAAPAVGRALLEAFGTVNADDIQELGLSSREFLGILVEQLTKLPRAAAGAKNAFENFRDTVFRAAATIGEALLPVLTRLVEVAAPIITSLANAFRALPAPLQSAVILLAALAAAAGPLTFIFGQLVTGLGRTLVGFVQLNALGILPTIANFRLLGQVMVGTASLASGAGATAAAAATGWGLLGIAIAGIITAVAVIATMSSAQKELAETTESQIASTQASLKVLRDQERVLGRVAGQTKETAKSNAELDDIYGSLNKSSQARVLLMQKEVGLTRSLQREVARLIEVRQQEQVLQAATIAAALTQTSSQIQEVNKQLDRAVERVEALRQARESLTTIGVLTPAQRKSFELQDIASTDVANQLKVIQGRIDTLTNSLPKLREQASELDKTWKAQSDALASLGIVTEEQIRATLEHSKSLGLFVGDVNDATKGILAFRKAQADLEEKLSGVTDELRKQIKAFNDLSDAADAAQKQRNVLISGAIDFLRENTDNINDARKGLENFIQLFPELGKAIEKQRKGRAIEEFLNELVGKKKAKGEGSGTGLRNAQESLAQALAEVAEASALELEAIERRKNDALLQANENAFRLQLKSYRDYLTTRAALTTANINLEISEQQRIVTEAVAEQQRAKDRLRGRLPAAERERVTAGAAEAEERQIKAQTRINDLRAEQNAVTAESRQLLREAAKEQLNDIRALEIEYAELKGKIEDALNAATDEKFRVALTDLALAQDDLNRRMTTFGDILSAEQKQEIALARAQNQRQIDAINAIVTQERALNRLVAINELVNRAKQKQSELERQIANDVDFRGLSEEQAIARRLAGEEKVKQSLLVARDIAQDTVNQLRETFGAEFPVPQALLDFIRQVNIEVQGLGKLTFTEQFRLAEKEFNRIQDELQGKIEDVERAIRSRDIAEVQGRLIIRRLNGEYIGDLERQLAVLEAIAAQSNDAALKRQAQQAGQATKDTRAAADELENFDRQLKSVAIDSFSDSLSQLFKDLRDNTESVAQDILGFFNNLANRIGDFIAEDFARRITESLFPDPAKGGRGGLGGLFDAIKGMFGLGGAGSNVTPTGAITETGAFPDAAVAAAKAAKETAAAAAVATALTTGGAAASTAMATGGAAGGATLATGAATAGATLALSITTAATAFSAAVIAAGTAFAAAVAAATASQGAGGALAGLGGEATGNIIAPVPQGKVIRVAEAGHAEAVLTTDPKHANRQLAILREYLRRTKGLYGRVKVPEPEFAAGAMLTPRQAEINLLSTIQRGPSAAFAAPEVAFAGAGGGDLRLRQILVDDNRRVGDFINSAEGETVIVDKLIRNRSLIRKLAR